MIKTVHVNTIRTLLSIALFGMFMLLSVDSPYNKFNPMYYLSAILMSYTQQNIVIYVCVSLVTIVLGGIGIFRFDPNSNERR